jgi:YjjG family noncanonical pyrimidine nucleotidase
MHHIKAILWDIDGTLLNFQAAEKYAIRACFARFGLGQCSDEMLADYSTINHSYWQRLERGELTKPQVLEGRFLEFFSKYGIDTGCAAAFNAQYQISLGDTFCFHEGGLETVQALQGKVKQYAVTNGTRIAQERKLKGSGLAELLDGVFISEILGVEKPGIGFFQQVWEQIGTYAPDEVMIVGDSLTSDIQGGNNAGILCCWFNPAGKPAPENLRIDYNIQTLSQILDLI